MICREFLLNHLAVLDQNNRSRAMLQASVTSGETYGDLARFCSKNKVPLDRRKREIEASQMCGQSEV